MDTSRSPPSDHASSSLPARNKRRNTALSCAECRRLKLRCSRQFPCSNCVKKGCGAICPEGSLTTGKGNRFVLANTTDLHEKIGDLSLRVRQLEDALAKSHAITHANEPHPLLSDELLAIKRPLEREAADLSSLPERPTTISDPEEAADAIGSLSISDSGRASFFGQGANSWYLLQNEGSDEEEDPDSGDVPTPSDLPWLSHAFPFTSSVAYSRNEVRASVMNMLPRADVAQRLVHLYYSHAGWMYVPILREDFDDRVFRRIYHADPYSAREPVDSHSLALLCIVLALGALLDLDLPSHPPEALQYYHLSRAALSIDSVFEDQTITAIQVLLLMCHYMFLADIEGARWVIMGIVVKLSQSVGLHRDSEKWQLGVEDTHRRRSLMWETYTYDAWQSLTYGRPPSYSLLHVDTQMAHGTTRNAAGEVEMSFNAWKHRFCAQCLAVVHDRVYGARAPSYATIQELDKKVREFYVPPSLQVPGFGGSKSTGEVEQPSLQLTMQRYIAFAIREIALFYMHRGFFARAVEENREDPLGSKYAPSVLAAYSTATSFVSLIQSLHSQHPALTERMWFLFTHVFSCSIVLGAIATKNRMALAPSALSHLESARNLFQQVSDARALKVLPILERLQQKARSAMAGYQARPSTENRSFSGIEHLVKSEPDEFSALGGGTRLVSKKAGSSSNPSSPMSSGRAGSHPGSSPIQSPGSQMQSISQSPESYMVPAPIPPASVAMENLPAPQGETNEMGWQGYAPSQNFQAASYAQPYVVEPVVAPVYADGGQQLMYGQVSMQSPVETVPDYNSYAPGPYYDTGSSAGPRLGGGGFDYTQTPVHTPMGYGNMNTGGQQRQGSEGAMGQPLASELMQSWQTFMSEYNRQ